jgi:hypothetical protein
MNPYGSFSQLLFTCVDGPISEVAATVVTGLNEPNEWSPRNAIGEVIKQYFIKEAGFEFATPYVDSGENCSTPLRVVFWEPIHYPNKTVLMGNHTDGMSHSVFRLSEDSPYTWINVQIHHAGDFPACFLDYYSQHRKIERRLVCGNFEDGWEFIQRGPAQMFENEAYYQRRYKKDRLTRTIITEYLERIGYRIREDSFWRTEKPSIRLWQEMPPSQQKEGGNPEDGKQKGTHLFFNG